jgi:YrbI family 3-deoxy-D-manno-octulosonate 8-phosphate phosphatase
MKQSWPALDHIHTIIFDFDGVFTDNKVYVSQEGREWVCCDRADGLGIDFLRRYWKKNDPKPNMFILSTERNPVVAARARKIRLRCVQGVSNKLAFVSRYLTSNCEGVPNPFAGLIYVANDLNDLPLLEKAGFSIVPSDAHNRVKQIASVVLPQKGGEGFVRAAVERLLGISNMTMEEIYELICDR